MRAAAPDLEYQPATPDDAPFAADVDSAVHPQRPRDPVVYRYWWSQPDEYMEFARFVVTRGRRPIGVADWSHPRWQVQPERYGTAGCEIVPAERSRTTLDAATAAMEARVVAEGARILRAWSNEDDPLRTEMLLARGYVEDRRSKRWELDLIANRDRLLAMTDASRGRMRSEGVQLLTLADDGDPAAVEKIWRLSEEAGDDVPTTVPRVPAAGIIAEASLPNSSDWRGRCRPSADKKAHDRGNSVSAIGDDQLSRFSASRRMSSARP